jgi:hypothetical protein
MTALACGIAFGTPVGAVATLSGATPVHAAAGLDTTATATYTIDFPAGVVRGRIEFGFVNSVADRPDGDVVELTYFEGFQFGLPGDAINVTAATADGPLALTIGSAEGFQLAAVDFGTNLEYQERLDMVVTFDLPGFPPRDPEPWRANEAFVAFVAWGFGDPGAGTVRIVTPTSAEVAMPELDDGSYPMPEVVTFGESTVHTFHRVAQPDEFALFVTAADDRKLVKSRLDINGSRVVVQAWPDDAGWADFMTAQVRAGIPALERLTGQPLDDDKRLILRESAKPSFEGYSGWFNYGTGVIEMGEELDPAVTLHELAHRWFNDDTSYHRWITEGLAETYATAVAERAGGTAHQPGVPRRRAPGKRPLNEWESFSFAQQDERAEKYGYNASFYVVDTLFDEIGPGRMADVLAAIDAGTPVYGASGAAGPGPVSWRRYLDLLEQVGGSERATALFRRFVVAAPDAAVLAERTNARGTYARLVEQGDEWAPPASVAEDMETWQFDDAGEVMTAALDVISARDRFDDAAAGTGIVLPTTFEARFEGATGVDSLDEIGEDIAELVAALRLVLAADTAAREERTTLGDLGLGREDFFAELTGARDAISAGDPAVAVDLAGQIQSALAVAEPVGRQRGNEVADAAVSDRWLVAAAVGAGLLAAAGITLVARRRRRRLVSGDVAAHVDAGGDAPVDADVEVGVGTRVELDEDALSGAGLGGVDRGLDAADGDASEGAGTTGVVEREPGLRDVGDPVLELGEDVGAVVDAQPVARTEVLVDPDAHGGNER